MDKKQIKRIIFIEESKKDIETLKLLRQAQIVYNINREIPVEENSNIIIHLNFLMFELSFKSLCVFYLGKYEETHFFKDESIIRELYAKIKITKKLKSSIVDYKKTANHLFFYVFSETHKSRLNCFVIQFHFSCGFSCRNF